MTRFNLSTAVLASVLVAIAAPAHAQLTAEPVFRGGITVQNEKPKPIVDGSFFGSGIGLTNYTGPDATAVSFWKPIDKNWDNNLRIGDLVDISATGQFGLHPDSHDPIENVWTQWRVTADPFVAHAGLNTTQFALRGNVVGPEGFHFEPDDVGFFYGYFGFGTASIFLQAKHKKLDWQQLDYTLNRTYEDLSTSQLALASNYEPATLNLMRMEAPTILNPEPSTLLLMGTGILLLLRRQFSGRILHGDTVK